MFDTAVIGAGIGGLRAAQLLVRQGQSVVVLEARSRVGGRLHSTADGLDLGATWFWAGETSIIALLRELDIATHEQHLVGDAVYHGRDGVQRLHGNPLDVPSGRFSRGAAALADGVAATLPDDVVRCNHAVTEIVAGNTIIASTAHGDVEAQQLVIALPPALAVHAINWSPGIPDEVRSLARVTPVWMGATSKVVARYPIAFWREAGLNGAAISHIGPMSEIHDMSGPGGTPAALFGFAPSALLHGDNAADQALQQLVVLFGDQAASPAELLIHDWRAEPFTSPPGVERLTAYQTFGHPQYNEPLYDGRVHWASTESAPSHGGHIEGALRAAERAANAILANAAIETAVKTRREMHQ